jgi:hypothetical protein
MDTTLEITATERQHELVAWAAELGAAIAEHSATHDREGTFVAEPGQCGCIRTFDPMFAGKVYPGCFR